jgi:hypothetical protein
MSGLERLVAGQATDFERQLLGAWDKRQPSSEAKGKVLALAGAGLGAVALGSATAAAAKGATTSIAPKAVLGWSAAVMKWVAVGLVGATATAGAIAYVRGPSRAPVDGAEVTPTPAAVPARPVAAAAATAEPATTIELGPDTAPVARAKSPPSARPSTLDEEVATIDQARRAVASGDATEALQIVGAYDARYPGGSLTQESTEIRIEALLLKGNRPAAERLAGKFVASHPSSPYVHRIRALLGESSNP